MAASYGCRSVLGGARSPFGAPPRLSFRRPNATTQLRAALHSLADRYLGPCGPWTLSTAEFSQTPGRPVVMPAGSMPKAARERGANPRAGAALAPYVGSHPDTSRSEQDDSLCNHISDNCQYTSDNKIQRVARDFTCRGSCGSSWCGRFFPPRPHPGRRRCTNQSGPDNRSSSAARCHDCKRGSSG